MDDIFSKISGIKNVYHTLLPRLQQSRKAVGYGSRQRCYAAVVVVDGYTVPDRLAKQFAYGIPVVFVRATHPFHTWNPSPTAEFWYNELQEGTDYVAATQDTVEAVLAKSRGA